MNNIVYSIRYLRDILNTQVKIKKWNSYCKKTNRKDINLLSHNDFITRIEKSKQTLEKHQFNAQRKFSLSEYTDVTGRKMKCYKLSREGNRKIKPVKKHTNKREIISKEEYEYYINNSYKY